MSEDATNGGVGGVKSARRVLDLLELLSHRRDGLTFPEIADWLRLPKSSLHSLLSTLAERDWIVLDEESRRYRTGVRTWEAGQGYLRGVNLARIADRHLEAARDALDETVQLAILDGIENVYIAKVEADRPLRLVSDVGVRLAAHATGLGKVLLAGLPIDEMRARFADVHMERFTAQTVTTLAELECKLDEIRAVGFGYDDGEYTEGIFCVAFPVFDHSGDVAAAMSCSAPKARLAGRDLSVERMRQVLAHHAAALSTDLGWRGELLIRPAKDRRRR